MRVLVTGANGHLGCNVVRELLQRGYDLVALVRPGADLRGIDSLGLAKSSLVRGDILDPTCVADAAAGCAAILHLAAPYRTRGSDRDILAPAIEGTRNVMRAAVQHQIARVVATSSVAAIGYLQAGALSIGDSRARPRTEANWNLDPRMPYFRAKVEAEREAWRMAKMLGVALVVLCPGGILGRHDYRTTPTTHYLGLLASGTGFSAPGGMNLVDVRDVAWAHVTAIETGPPGARYAIGGEDLSYRSFATRIAEATGVAARHVPLPRAVLLPFLRIHEIVDNVRGREPYETYLEAYETLGRHAYLDSGLATRVLGYRPRPALEAIHDGLRWLAFRGELPTPIAARVSARLPPDPDWTP